MSNPIRHATFRLLLAVAGLLLSPLPHGGAAITGTSSTEATVSITKVLDEVVVDPTARGWEVGHSPIFQLDPGGPVIWPPPPPLDPSRYALSALDTATNEFEAPPLIVTKITALPAASGLSATQIVERFERNLLRERIILADRMYRRGDSTNAIALLQDLNQYLRNPRNRILNLNRLAAYHFRRQDYTAAANLMRTAVELDRSDTITTITLSAVLMTLGRLDEALGFLLEIYPASLDRPQLAFSVHFSLACVYSLKKNMDKSLQNLALAAQIDPASTMASLGDPQLDFLRTDSRFSELSVALENYLLRAQQP